MGYQSAQARRIWELVAQQHGVVSREQLIGFGVSGQGIKRRRASGRLHQVMPGVYAAGRPELSREGRWMAVVLACGPSAVLSHASAAALWRIGGERDGRIEVSVVAPRAPRRPGVRVHRRSRLQPADLTTVDGIPVTSPTPTLIDLATRLSANALEAAINDADKHDLVDPEGLRAALEAYAGRPGVARIRAVLDRRTFTLTDSELERLLLPIARRAGLSVPLTRERVNGFKVDFYWPDLGLVVETDGLRYHRTPAQQTRDRRRDQAHAAAGLTPLRFSHAQVKYEPRYVQATLASVARGLERP